MPLVIFLIVYIVSAILTYFPSWYRATGFMDMGATSYAGLIVLYLIMIAVSIYLGIIRKANWLFLFPLVAGIIAIIWPLSVMWLAIVINIIGIILGVIIYIKNTK